MPMMHGAYMIALPMGMMPPQIEMMAPQMGMMLPQQMGMMYPASMYQPHPSMMMYGGVELTQTPPESLLEIMTTSYWVSHMGK
jgi:hypothetical protein